MANLSKFTIEARYETGAIQARIEIEATDAIAALNRIRTLTWALGVYPANSLRSDLLIFCDGGPVMTSAEVVAASMRRVAA